MAAPTIEIITDDQLNEGSAITTDIELLLEIISKINWKEPFLMAVMIVHVATFICILSFRKRPYILMWFLIIMGILCLSSEYINEWAAKNHKLLLSEQYFDSSGAFISIILSVPILINSLTILIAMLIESCSTLQVLAKLKINSSSKQNHKKTD
jgi:hypothetical protein